MDAVNLDQESFLHSSGGPLWEDDAMTTCEWCEGEIDQDQPVHVVPDPERPGHSLSVCELCAPSRALSILERHPARDRAEETAREVLRIFARQLEAGLWSKE